MSASTSSLTIPQFNLHALKTLLENAYGFQNPGSSKTTGLSAGSTLSRGEDMAHRIHRLSSFWVPLTSLTLTILFGFRYLESYHVTLSGTLPFSTACPEDGRRTQESVLVKSFTVTVTTLGIHGYLGSLAGSKSWRRQLHRIVEVLVKPLASVFSLGNAVWYETANSLRRRTVGAKSKHQIQIISHVQRTHHSPFLATRHRKPPACHPHAAGSRFEMGGQLTWSSHDINAVPRCPHPVTQTLPFFRHRNNRHGYTPHASCRPGRPSAMPHSRLDKYIMDPPT
ncbi:hypothetical protein EJ02DRAFT_466180 [Clathrospora elynae]|uniref:Uncharacterized protein n=1 Tax=Clathrospora elynae TaxID=706981 RepID=A0A6A5SNX8_9PLEO|nr:hypothetical protein EJ02DRAFT_466180 [Clathrospora elynae]